MSAGVPVLPANLRIADVIEATGEVFELPPLVRAMADVAEDWCGCTYCDWSGWASEREQDGSIARQGRVLCPECFSLVEVAE